MGLKWKKLKLLWGKKVCVTSVTNPTDEGRRSGDLEGDPFHDDFVTMGRRSSRFSRSASECTRLNASETRTGMLRPTLSCSESHTSGNHVSKSTCSICLEALKPGNGQALFTAECSHVFHFACIAANVRHGNIVCPICRARWKDVPWQGVQDGSRSASHSRAPSADSRLLADNGQINFLGEQRRRNLSFQYMGDSLSRNFLSEGEPDLYNDDDSLSQVIPSDEKRSGADTDGSRMPHNLLSIETYSEVSSVPACDTLESLTVLLHLNAPLASTDHSQDSTSSSCPKKSSLRAPIDLVAVLDTSGSMAGRKLVLLKQAMSFVVRNLSSADRLSVVVFSSTAKRVFPLRKMGEDGQRQAIQAMDALMASGGTNIAEGLKKGVKILEERREKNPISSIMLLSDGQDTYNMSSGRQLPFLLGGSTADSRRLVPRSIRRSTSIGHLQIPIHTFGFGTDHDSSTMHAIAEVSGGTFSFIQAEEMVQDAFAQCIGGLLSVVAQDVELTIACLSRGVRINVIHAGSYQSTVVDEGRHGNVRLGDLYAEEQRDVLIELKLPVFMHANGAMSMPLLEASCVHKDPITREAIRIPAHDLCIDRPPVSEKAHQVISLEVDRQRNRLQTAAVIAEARSLADEGNFEAAQNRLQSARTQLEISPSARAGDQLCNVLDFELKEMHERMATRQLYERSGRAYLLSAQSSHLRQRATTRGDSLDGLMHDYQTQSMVDMVTLSQTRSLLERNMVAGLPSASRKDPSQARISGVPNRSVGRSLFHRVSAKVLRTYGGV
ncbi:hypothetical protein GOP47_0016776 [Adiantum capillus-veneris]|uniref:Uncharacterized protein n=1 Tax=Adiantum capillus-veneris TaxID=13818 RepID=A0A9D4UJA6_ADICA|nr:hypothetical protein GOP47_0016776 [Adiantum capillus-veneris]